MRVFLKFCLISALLFVGACKDDTHGFLESFANEQELKYWAKNSTPDTGRFHELEFGNEKLMLVYRSHDEMARHSDLGVYQKKDGAWSLIKSLPPGEEGIFEAKIYKKKLEFNFLGKPDEILLKITRDDLL